MREPLLVSALVGCLATTPAGCDRGQGAAAGGGHEASAVVSLEAIPKHTGGYPIRAVATTGMVTDLVVNIGAPHVQVEGLMGEGVDPHLYKASPGDLQKLVAANIIFYNGLHLEGRMADVFVRLARSRPTFAVTETIPHELLREPPEFLGQYDPHVWFDVSLWARAAERVTEVLAAYDPPHAADYRQRGSEYHSRLLKLHDEVKTRLLTIPEEQRLLVTAHDAFGYFGRAYQVTVRGIQGMTTDSEAGVREIEKLVDFIVSRKVKAVFVETSVSERYVRALVEGCAARGHQVRIGGQLYSDALGRPGTPEGTYEGMVRHNVETIVRALR